MDESMALTKLLVKNCVLKITGLEAFSNGRRKPVDKTINATEQVLVLEMPGDCFKLVVEAAPATQQVLPSGRLGARARSRDPSARSAFHDHVGSVEHMRGKRSDSLHQQFQ